MLAFTGFHKYQIFHSISTLADLLIRICVTCSNLPATLKEAKKPHKKQTKIIYAQISLFSSAHVSNVSVNT